MLVKLTPGTIPILCSQTSAWIKGRKWEDSLTKDYDWEHETGRDVVNILFPFFSALQST